MRKGLKRHLKNVLMKKQRGRCYVCKEKVRNLELHHIQPKSMGGDDELDNLVLLCKPCHKLVHEELEISIKEGLPYSFFKSVLVRVRETYDIFREVKRLEMEESETFKRFSKHKNMRVRK